MSQVVIVHKKTGDIHLCVDFRALNAITVCDLFPLPRIEETLQAVKAAVLVYLIQFGPRISTTGYERGRHPKDCIPCWIIRFI